MKRYHSKAKILSLHHKIEILDEQDNVAYRVQSKAISIHDRTYIEDGQGNQVAYTYAKVLSLHDKHFVEMADGFQFEISTELFHLLSDVIDIDTLGWKLKGDFMEHNYEIIDGNDQTIASLHHKWISLHDVYEIEIFDESQTDRLITTFIVLEHILTQRAESAASSASAAGAHGAAHTAPQTGSKD